ncbi:MAG: hypothetical protein WBG36_10680 [Ornithinimicrobium sp.]
MSQMTATARVAPRAARSRPASRPSLRVVHAAPAAVSHLWFALVIGALVLGGLLAMLMLNMARAEGSFVLSDLRAEQEGLHAQQVTLETEVADLSSPATLAGKAERLGMVPSPSTATVRLSDSSVVGVAAVVVDGKTLTVDLPGASGTQESPQPGE